MSPRCANCDGDTVWDDAVGSSVCTSCGTLVDPSQSVLTSVPEDTSPAACITLKSLRSGHDWDLPGQGKEARDRRNAFAIATFITSLAASLNVRGVAPRATALFNQARNVLQFRWGHRSRSIAAACLAIALRESNRPDTLRDVASVVDIPFTSLTREFTTITAALGLSLALLDPSVYMPTLQAHLSTSLRDTPASLSKPLENLNFHHVTETANSLSRLLTRLSTDHDVLRLPVPPTACAIYLLALEGHLRAPLNPLSQVAGCLGARFQVAKAVVMTRYKTIQDEIASWAESLPWLDKHESKKGRPKLSKRLVVARSLEDIILFQEDIWEKRSKLTFPFNILEEGGSIEHRKTRTPKSGPKPHRAVTESIQFLLDPVGSPVPNLIPASPVSFPTSQISLAAYLLTTPSATMSVRPPTRLQMLANVRGGSSEDHIRDEELFADGEIEGFLRNEDEVHAVRETLGWDDEDTPDDLVPTSSRKGKRKRNKEEVGDLSDPEDRILNGSVLRPRKTRLNVEGLTRFMSGSYDGPDDSEQFMGLQDAVDEAALENMETDSVEEENARHVTNSRQTLTVSQLSGGSVTRTASTEEDEEVILHEWRPPSPGLGVIRNDSRYEEERPP